MTLMDHAMWEKLRDEADQQSRLKWEIRQGTARMEYRIVQLSNKKWTGQFDTHTADGGMSIPWLLPRTTRQQMLDDILDTCRDYFRARMKNTYGTETDKQKADMAAMLDRLGPGLFGFDEPTPVEAAELAEVD